MEFNKPVFRLDSYGDVRSRYAFDHTDLDNIADLAAEREFALNFPLAVDWVSLGDKLAYEWIFEDKSIEPETSYQLAISFLDAVKFDYNTSEMFIRDCINKGLVGNTLLVNQDGGPDHLGVLTGMVSVMNAPDLIIDEVDWERIGEFRSLEIIMDSFDRNNGSSVLTLRLFHAAITALSKTQPDAALALIARMEAMSGDLLVKHLKGIGMDLESYKSRDGQFTRREARHLSDYSRWRFRLLTEEFPGSMRSVIDLTLSDLSTAPATVRDAIAAHL